MPIGIGVRDSLTFGSRLSSLGSVPDVAGGYRESHQLLSRASARRKHRVGPGKLSRFSRRRPKTWHHRAHYRRACTHKSRLV